MTDVFKFMAVRPPELATKPETTELYVRDERFQTEAEEVHLSGLASSLAEPGEAQRRWAHVQLDQLHAVAQGAWDLIETYRALAAEPEVAAPAADELLDSCNLGDLTPEARLALRDQAWDALYVAFATGPAAGKELEPILAVLKLLHFLDRLDEGAEPGADEALKLLGARVLISPAFKAGFRWEPAQRSHDEPEEAAEEPGRPVVADGRARTIATIAENLAASSHLLQSLNNASQRLSTAVSPSVVAPTSQWDVRARISTAPTAKSAIPAKITATQARILNQLGVADDTPAPAAAQLLMNQVRQISDLAQPLAGAADFQNALTAETRKYSLSMDFVDLAGQVHLVDPDILDKISASSADDGHVPDVDMSGRIKPLGIGDLKVVKEQLISYVAGEVADIENVLASEVKKRTHRRLDRTEVTLFEADEETKESERDNQSTDRFELKSEAAKTIKEDNELKAGIQVTGGYGPVKITATGDFAHKTSVEESVKSSSNFSKEVVSKSVDKVQMKVRSERTTKTITEVEELNEHSFTNNGPGAENITGVYRWVDKKYRAQVYNYGARLLVEFLVAEPAAYYRATKTAPTPEVSSSPPPPFVQSFDEHGLASAVKKSTALEVEHLSALNYTRYASLFNAPNVDPPPPVYAYVGTTLATAEDLGDGKPFTLKGDDKFAVPDGYMLLGVQVVASAIRVGYPRLGVQVQNQLWEFDFGLSQPDKAWPKPIHQGSFQRPDPYSLGDPTVDHLPSADPATANNDNAAFGIIPVAVTGYDIRSVAVNVELTCRLTVNRFRKWQLETHQKLHDAWVGQQKAYDQEVADAKARLDSAALIQGQNPGSNRIVEANELKKLCVTMMTGEHFDRYGAVSSGSPPELEPLDSLRDGRIAQFFEQAFEWEQMTYLYYPYFWGRKPHWPEFQYISDPDPLFERFLAAGMARVLVPVPVPYAESVQYLLANPLNKTDISEKVWMGGEAPGLDDDTYRSIAEELKDRTDDLAGAIPEGDPWEYRLPTTLVWLQPDDTLPTDFD